MPAKLKFNYSFLPQGTVVRTGTDLEPAVNTFYLDLGNSSEKGVFDHHHLTSGDEKEKKIRSTTGIVAVNKDKVRANFDPGKVEKSDGQEFININIICHRKPDFDCYASVYILCQYLTEIYHGTKAYGESETQFFKLLAAYADAIDSAQIDIDAEQLKTPYAVASVIEEVLREKKELESSGNKRDEEYPQIHLDSLKRGLVLIASMFPAFERKKQELQSAHKSMPEDYSALHDKDRDMFDIASFQPEIQYLGKDYQKYLDDIKNRSTAVRKIKLPVVSGDDIQIEEVDAIFFNTVPSCSQHKHWARTDQLNSPARNGFVFTFIPMHTGPRENNELPPNGEEINTSQVIISVREGSRVSLRGLGEALEAAELQAEEKLIPSEDINKWRTRLYARWPNEEWCTNIDPWYDGRNHNYTIVDAPGKHYSLLSINEIMEITQDYITPRLSDNFTRHIIPFAFSNDNYREICECLNANDYERVSLSAGNNCEVSSSERLLLSASNHYFLSYIEEYMFNSNQEQCSYYHYEKTKLKSLAEQLNLDKNVLFEDLGVDLNNREFMNLRMQLDDAYIALFKYGVGFLILDVRIYCVTKDSARQGQEGPFTVAVECQAAGSITVDSLNSLNKIFDKKEIFVGKIENIIQDKIDTLGGVDTFNCSIVDLFPNSLCAKKQKEIAYKLSNLDGLSTYSLTSFTQETSNFFYHPAPYACCYQGIKGTCMVIDKNTDEREKKTLHARFLGTDFFILLLSLHQRHILLNMSSQLARYSRDINEGRKKKVTQLRQHFLEFVIRSWFSQITNDDAGMGIYRRWQERFNNQTIFEEVSNQIQAFDDFNREQMSKALEFISAVFFPLLTFDAVYNFVNKFNLPTMVFGYQTIFSWLAAFALIESLWLFWLHRWRPLPRLRKYFKERINKITSGLSDWWPIKKISKSQPDNKSSLSKDM